MTELQRDHDASESGDSATASSSSLRRQRLLEKMRVLTSSLKNISGDEEDTEKKPTAEGEGQTIDLSDSFDSIASRETKSAPSFPPRIGVSPPMSSPYDAGGPNERNVFLSYKDLVYSSRSDLQQDEDSSTEEGRASTEASRRALRRKFQLLAECDTVMETDQSNEDTNGTVATKSVFRDDRDNGCLATRMSLVMPSSCYSSEALDSQPERTEPRALYKRVHLLAACNPLREEKEETDSPVGAISRSEDHTESARLDLMFPPSLAEEDAFAYSGMGEDAPGTTSKYRKRMQMLKACAPRYSHQQSFSSVHSISSRSSANDTGSKEEIGGTSSRRTQNRNVQLLAACNPLRDHRDERLNRDVLPGSQRPPVPESASSSRQGEQQTAEKQVLTKPRSRRGLLKKMHVLTYCNPLREHPSLDEINNELDEGELAATPPDPSMLQQEKDSSVQHVDQKELSENDASSQRPNKVGPLDLDVEPDNEYSDSLFRAFGNFGSEEARALESTGDDAVIETSASAEHVVVDGGPSTPPRPTTVTRNLQQTDELRVMINVTTHQNDATSTGKSSVPTSPGNTASVSTLDPSGFPIEAAEENLESPNHTTDEGDTPDSTKDMLPEDTGLDAFFQPFMDFLLGPADDHLNDAVHSLDDEDDLSSSYSATSGSSTQGTETDFDSVAVQVKAKEHIPKEINLNGESRKSRSKAVKKAEGPVPKAISAVEVDRPMSPMADGPSFEKLPCACGKQEECNGISAAFFMLNDERAGYIQVPEFRSNAESHFDLETNRLRDALLRPFFSADEREALEISGDQLYVANHHFHPGIISSQAARGTKGILPMYISEKAMGSLSLELLEHDQVLNGNGVPTGYYYVVPSYRFDDTKEDLKKAIKARRIKLENSKHKHQIDMLREHEERSFSSTIAQTLDTKSGQAWYDRVY